MSERPETGGPGWQRCPLRPALRAARAAAPRPPLQPPASGRRAAPARPPAAAHARSRAEAWAHRDRREPAGGARAPEPRALDPSPRGAQLAPVSLGGRPPAAERRCERGRRVSAAPRTRRLLPSPGNPPLAGMPAAPPLLAPGCPSPDKGTESGVQGCRATPPRSQVPQFGEGATHGGAGAWGRRDFAVRLASLRRGYGADSRAGRTEGSRSAPRARVSARPDTAGGRGRSDTTRKDG